jgi:hypothetical protein
MSIFQRPLGATLLLGTALGTPYVLFETEPGTQLRRAVAFENESQSASADGVPASDSFGTPLQAPTAARDISPPKTQSDAKPTWTDELPMSVAPSPIDLRQVIRFDVTPDFVYRSFPRVSTVLSDLSLDGLRVPLISGTQPYDVAGSLTYYFDTNKTVRRIQFQGVTGDAGPLMQLMIQHYRLVPERSLGGQLLTMRWNNRVTSFIHIAPAPVVSAQQPNARFAFFMEINKPTDHYGLSQQASQMLMQAQAAQRW